MRKLALGLLILMTGWGLGWYTYMLWGTAPGRSAQPVVPAQEIPADPEEATAVLVPPAAVGGDSMEDLLRRNAFDAVLARYESLQDRADEAALDHARARILAHARRLIAERRFSLAEQLLQQFLVAAYRDAEARVLLAEALRGQGDVLAVIDQLYEARGHAWQPDMLQRITARIRSVVAERVQVLEQEGDRHGLLALYQHLVQSEPDHAPWFMGLANAQLALDDIQAARSSLLLVAQDPDVGAQAQALLAELSIALAELQDAAPEVAGIPLHRRGNHFIVDAQPARGRSIRLLIDTGASLTIFTPQVLEQRGIRYRDTGRTGVFNTANGRVRAPVYRLDSLAVGDWQVRDLEIAVLDLGSRSGVDGLLGMNFLKRFRFFIDQNEAMLRLSAN